MTENEFLLQDRIAKIKSINEKYNLLENSYISFSGGKDSTVLSYLIDEALPDNKIPRVFINTGIEYNLILKFVKEKQMVDDRIYIYNIHKNIKEVLEQYGYPFKSKEHSLKLFRYKKIQNENREPGRYLKKYFNMSETNYRTCPKSLMYQIEKDFTLNISDKCCTKLKKEPIKYYMKQSGKRITITGMMRTEGGQRSHISCIVNAKDNTIEKFHPMATLNEDWEKWYIETRKIKLCDLYYPPYNFNRTGCKGCPFNPDLQKQLDKMEYLLPNEKKQCEIIWKPIYDEYRRIGYRLKK